jgi:glycosyltransferase involved in cell wall biosynthesis
MSPDDGAPHRYRVAMVAAKPFPVPQGSQVLVQQTAQLLQSRGHDVHLVVYGYGLGDAPPGLTIHRGANIIGARKTLAGPSWGKPFQDLALVRALRDVLRRHAIDIVHAHNYEGLLVALLAGYRPIVYHAHTCLRDELPHFVLPRALARGLGAFADASLPQRADAVIALHDRARGYLIDEGCRADRVFVIPPPMDLDIESDTHNEAKSIASDSSSVSCRVVYTGNLDAYQNLGLLSDAMDFVRAREPLAQLHIATADTRPYPGADARVATPDAASLRAALAGDVVVACPRVSWSGYPIKLLNAMAAGKPIVACAGAAHGLVHRQSALIVPDNDSRAFADALLELMHDAALRRRLGDGARNAARANHQPDIIAAMIEPIYAGLAIVR